MVILKFVLDIPELQMKKGLRGRLAFKTLYRGRFEKRVWETLIKRMNKARILAGCVAFQGKKVVSGRCDADINGHFYNLNTVETYCNIDNTWSTMLETATFWLL